MLSIPFQWRKNREQDNDTAVCVCNVCSRICRSAIGLYSHKCTHQLFHHHHHILRIMYDPNHHIRSRCIGIAFFFRVLHTIFSHLRAHAFARSVTVARSSAVHASSGRRQERRWAIVCGSPQSQSTDSASSR